MLANLVLSFWFHNLSELGVFKINDINIFRAIVVVTSRRTHTRVYRTAGATRQLIHYESRDDRRMKKKGWYYNRSSYVSRLYELRVSEITPPTNQAVSTPIENGQITDAGGGHITGSDR